MKSPLENRRVFFMQNIFFKFFVFFEKLKTMKQKYDSSVVYLYATGNENILPQEFRRKIPYPTISTWRKTDYSQYLGHEFRYIFADAFTNAELSYKYHGLKKGVMSMAKAWISLASVVRPVLKDTKGNKLLQKRVLDAIHHMKAYIGIERTLKMLDISRTMYQQWLLESRFNCFDSYSGHPETKPSVHRR